MIAVLWEKPALMTHLIGLFELILPSNLVNWVNIGICFFFLRTYIGLWRELDNTCFISLSIYQIPMELENVILIFYSLSCIIKSKSKIYLIIKYINIKLICHANDESYEFIATLTSKLIFNDQRALISFIWKHR